MNKYIHHYKVARKRPVYKNLNSFNIYGMVYDTAHMMLTHTHYYYSRSIVLHDILELRTPGTYTILQIVPPWRHTDGTELNLPTEPAIPKRTPKGRR
jgi:hypothetical protein